MRALPIMVCVLLVGMLVWVLLGEEYRLSPGQAAAAGVDPKGDASCDGVVNAIDAALILQSSAGLTLLDCVESADVNGDSRVDSIDASLVLQLTAGLIDTFIQCDVTVGPRTAQDTIDQVQAGTTVCLREGTYSSIRIIRKSEIQIVGAGNGTVVSDSGDSVGCVFVFESQSIGISDLATSNCVERGAFAASSTDVIFQRMETRGGPVGFHFVHSDGKILDSVASNHHRSSPPGFGVLVNEESTVTIDGSAISDADIGVLSRDDSTLVVKGSDISDNEDVGIITMVDEGSAQRTGRTSIERTTIRRNGLGVFAGVPGCADLPPADPTAPTCFVDSPSDFVSNLVVEIFDSTIEDSESTGVVIFPGGEATISGSEISGNGLTGLFVWGARVDATNNEYDGNVENAIECRAYPGPATGDRGMCSFTNEHIHNSLPLPGNSLGGGFVSEGANFRLASSLIEGNWGIGVQVLHGGGGEIISNTIEGNGGTAFCFSETGALEVRDNATTKNRAGECLGHP